MMTGNAGALKRLRRTKAQRNYGLNLVGLMDIFTILVFFLLVNSVEVQDIPARQEVQLPESVAEQAPRQTVTLMVTEQAVMLDGEPILAVSELTESPEAGAEALRRALAGLEELGEAESEVTVLGDRGLPFRLLKQVMTSATSAGFERVSLAVIQKSQGGADS